MAAIMPKAALQCPKCCSQDVMPIVYGYPAPGWEKEVSKGTFALGGCVVDGSEPDYECRKCHAQFKWPARQ
jgi:ribosomal protein L40E